LLLCTLLLFPHPPLIRRLSTLVFYSMLGLVPYSPDLDVFTTPPTTPMTTEPPNEAIIRPSLSRSSSRPSNLHISKTADDFKPDILVESQSPQNVLYSKSPVQVISPRSVSTSGSSSIGVVKGRAVTGANSNERSGGSGPNSHPEIPTITTTDNSTQTSVTSPHSVTSAPIIRPPAHSQSPMTSPCFVHSNLDKFSEWLKSSNGLSAVDVAAVLKPMSADLNKTPSRRKIDIAIPWEDAKAENVFDASDYDYDDDEGSASLTKQLADTAVGVREMSMKLGALLGPPSFLPKVLNNGRSYTHQIKYSDCADCDQGAGQSPHRTYACPSTLPHEKAQV
jgi:NAD+ kinase